MPAFGPVPVNRAAAVSAVWRIALKALVEAVRAEAFGPKGVRSDSPAADGQCCHRRLRLS